MKRTGDSVTAHPTAYAQVGSEVGAVGVEDPRRPVLATKEHEVPPEVGLRVHVAGHEFPAAADTEPAIGRGGKGVAGAHPSNLRLAYR